jgi:hypothetical protein
MARRRLWSFCGSREHDISRRSFLGGLAAGAAALAGGTGAVNAFAESSLAGELKRRDRRVILLWLAGGASQLETWDPKPGRPTGGPFAAIPTAIPGVHISELMPKMARRLDRTCIIRSLNTRDGDHGGASELMMRGRRDEPNLKYPDLGAVLARELGRAESLVPDYVSLYSATEGRNFSKLSPGFLGSRYAPIQLAEEMRPPFLERPESISELDHCERAELQKQLGARFLAGRGSEAARSHAEAYARVNGLMSSAALFDIEREPQHARDRYGPTLFGRQVLMARRMVEAGVPFVRVARAWWDSHGQNFETHQEMVPELDHVLAALLDDLKERGLLDHTLVITLGEFGRTPAINASLGRDHFATAWSATLSGCGVHGGAVYGKTDKDGHRVADGEIGAGALFATILAALGIDHEKEYLVGSRPVPLVDPGIEPVKELIA